ncbi:hypothetical protein KCU99_g7203, partial [Aureobasidium melanogenum]
MDPIETYPLTLDLSHKWGDEADTKIEASILSFLSHTTHSAHEVAKDTSLAVEPEHNIGGFRDEVEDVCIYWKHSENFRKVLVNLNGGISSRMGVLC